MYHEVFSVAAGLTVLAAFVPYIYALAKKRIQPAKASWLIWAALDTITLAGMWAKDSLNGQIVGCVIGVWIVAALALKNGIPGWTWLDRWCLIGGSAGIILWMMFHDPLFGIVISVAVIFIGSIPTFVSAYRDPNRENKMAWTLFWVSCLFAIAAISEWTLATGTQPVVFLIIESVMMYLLFVRRPKR